MKARPADVGLRIALLAMALRGGWSLWRWFQAGPALEFDDERLHWELARNLVTLGELVSDDGRYVARMPLYPFFLALFAPAGDFGILGARLAQAALGAASAWVAHAATERQFGSRAGLAAGLLVAVDPFGIFFSGLLLSETLFTLLGAGLTACALRIAAPHGASTAPAAAGVAILGVACVFTRPSAAGWIGLLWVALFLLDQPRRAATVRLALYGAALAAPLLLWGWRNTRVVGAPAWLSANGGLTLYDGHHPGAAGGSDQSFLANMPELAGLGEVERDRRLSELAWEQIRRDPAHALRLAGVKFLRTWSLFPNYERYRGGLAGWAGAAYTAMVLLGAALGAGRLVRVVAGRRVVTLLVLPMVYFTLLHCVYVGSVRYRAPLMPFCAMLCGAALGAERAARAERAAGRSSS